MNAPIHPEHLPPQEPPTSPERIADSLWAEGDPGVQAKYAGQWVAAYERAVAAADVDFHRAKQAARDELARRNAPGEAVILVYIPTEEDWFFNA